MAQKRRQSKGKRTSSFTAKSAFTEIESRNRAVASKRIFSDRLLISNDLRFRELAEALTEDGNRALFSYLLFSTPISSASPTTYSNVKFS